MKLREPDLIQRTWPEAERATARLLALGPNALSDAEIVAVLLRKGKGEKSAVELARELIGTAGGLSKLGDPRASERTELEARARLAAAFELARRSLMEQMRTEAALTSPAAVRDYLRLRLRSLDHEVFLVVMLDSQHRVLACEELFRGTLTQTSVYPREVVRTALGRNAAAIICAHNHPSGVAQPSQADELLTRSLKEALALVDIRILDHFVIAGNQALSFAERGLL